MIITRWYGIFLYLYCVRCSFNTECVITRGAVERFSYNFLSLSLFFTELMILGFISLLFNVFQGAIGRFCMPKDFAYHMLPCKRSTVPVVNHFSSSNFVDHNYNIHRHLLSTTQANFQHCSRKVRVCFITHLMTIFIITVFIYSF